MSRALVLLLAALCFASRAAAENLASADDTSNQFFESRIRPLLVERCYSCHSDGAKRLKGGLYLDSREGMLKGGDSGEAIIPGAPEKSRLIDAIGYKNVDLQMPPKDKLSDAQIADVTTWVKMGAPWPKGKATAGAGSAKGVFDLAQRKASHWAWQPIKVSAPPAVKDATWARDPIDQYILAALEAKGMHPAPDVDRRSLIRRAYLDLIGLPPTPADVQAFIADPSDGAFANVIDHLLASPQFGERWARHWMDLARYGETYGHEFDFPINYAWQYRDYLIRAFNADVPYDQFVTEQIAGDLLERARLHPQEGYNESIIGTGFWWLAEQGHSPVDVRVHQADRVDNQIDTMGKTFLGLTLGCARCHDHKFDAISQKDTYALWGFVESSRLQAALLDPRGKIHDAALKLQKMREAGDAAMTNLAPRHASGTGEAFSKYLLAARAISRDHASPEQVAAKQKLDLAQLGRWVAALSEEGAKQPTHPMYAWSQLGTDASAQFALHRQKIAAGLKAQKGDATSVLFKDFKDGNFNGWYVTGEAFGAAPTRAGQWDSAGRALHFTERGAAHSGMMGGQMRGVLRSPDFTIEHDTILYHAAGRNGQIRLIVDGFTMDMFNRLLFAGHEFKINQEQFGWIAQTKDVARYIGHRAHIELIDDDNGWLAVDEIRFADGGAPPHQAGNGVAAEIAADAKISSPEALAAAYGARWSKTIEQWRGGALDCDAAQWVNWALDHDLIDRDAAQATNVRAIAQAMESLDNTVPEPMHVLAMADGDAVDEHVYIRGNPKSLGEVAPRRFLEALAGTVQAPVGKTSGRLELARRMTDASDPLLPRVMVNRLWHHLFGRGIVASADNLGVLGSAPTHPELLDFLAARFVKEGWSIKRTLRELMLSRAYQMTSAATDTKAEEADPQNLLLHRANVRRLEGEQIRDQMLAISGRLDPTMFGPPVEVYITAFMDGRGKPANSGPLDGAGRRSIYTAVRRNFLSPMMLAFDTPIPFSTIGRRSVSNVPAQALILMNDPFVVLAAQSWARRMLLEKDLTSEQRIEKMYQAAFCRAATEKEVRAGVAFLERQGEALGVPSAERPSDFRVWSDYAHVLMNLKEFIFLN